MRGNVPQHTLWKSCVLWRQQVVYLPDADNAAGTSPPRPHAADEAAPAPGACKGGGHARNGCMQHRSICIFETCFCLIALQRLRTPGGATCVSARNTRGAPQTWPAEPARPRSRESGALAGDAPGIFIRSMQGHDRYFLGQCGRIGNPPV
jgi:hypothetical protein